MLDTLETLIALKKYKTMSAACHHLRISQSAVSKRIATLERDCNKKLITRTGRRVSLTEDAEVLLQKVSLHIGEIREALSFTPAKIERTIILGISESILSSWGPSFLKHLLKSLDIKIEYHCHRSPLVLEKVEAGIYDFGICAGHINKSRSVCSELLKYEDMVLVSNKTPKKEVSDLICIEESSATWKSIKGDLQKLKLAPFMRVESFFSIAQMAKSGLGTGLIPSGVADTIGFKKDFIKKLKLKRPIQIIFKKSKLEDPLLKTLLQKMIKP